jgi:hypothetical protein
MLPFNPNNPQPTDNCAVLFEESNAAVSPLLAKADIACLIVIPFASSSRTPLSPIC